MTDKICPSEIIFLKNYYGIFRRYLRLQKNFKLTIVYYRVKKEIMSYV